MLCYEVARELWRQHQLIYRAFDVYAALDVRQGGVVAISANSFHAFCAECGILSDEKAVQGQGLLSAGAISTLFKGVNANSLLADGTEQEPPPPPLPRASVATAVARKMSDSPPRGIDARRKQSVRLPPPARKMSVMPGASPESRRRSVMQCARAEEGGGKEVEPGSPSPLRKSRTEGAGRGVDFAAEVARSDHRRKSAAPAPRPTLRAPSVGTALQAKEKKKAEPVVRTEAERAKIEARRKHKLLHGLNRAEFIHCLVRLAAMRYVEEGRIPDLSTALRKFLQQMGAALDTQLHVRVLRDASQIVPSNIYCKQDDATAYLSRSGGDLFRATHCYTDEMEKVLRRHEASLRVIFKVYAEGIGGVRADRDNNCKALLGLDEFTIFVADLALVGPDFPMRLAVQQFVFSRMRTIDELDDASRARLLNLTLPDFLELLVRIADCKVWPSDEEVQQLFLAAHRARCAAEDVRWRAAELVFRMQRDAGSSAYAAFVARARPPQPVWQKMENLILLIVHHIDLNHDKALGDKEVRTFVRRSGAAGAGD